jgi:ribosomal protein RSM22 (predicted rRNA methylase)
MLRLNQILATLSKGMSSAELKTAYEQLSKAYRDRTKIVLDTSILQLAYLQARMPATVAVLSSVLKHLQPYQEQIKTLLDLGSGPGSVLWAAQDILLSLEKATCIDQSMGLLNFGKTILDKSDSGLKVDWQKGNLTKFNFPGPSTRVDLVSLSYVLNELPMDSRSKILTGAWQQNSAFLVLVEPGTPQGFQNIQDARTFLIQQGAKILAPCTHENTCPMSMEDWCHFSVRLQRSRTHQTMKGSLPYEDEKFSYLIATKLSLNDRPAARIVKNPKSSTGLVEFELCDQNGLTRVKVSKRDKDLFKRARKLEWGDGF